MMSVENIQSKKCTFPSINIPVVKTITTSVFYKPKHIYSAHSFLPNVHNIKECRSKDLSSF